MRLRNIRGADQIIQESDWVIQEPEKQKGNWNLIFLNENPIHIEIGMGKGKFIIKMAKEFPNINFIGIEKYTSVLLRGIQKVEDEKINNLKFLCIDAENLPNIFDEGEVKKIYLNFSDPWPKDRHAKRRLPSKEFLARYDKILNRQGTIEFKTDNRGLFDFALDELEPAGWNLVNKIYLNFSDPWPKDRHLSFETNNYQ